MQQPSFDRLRALLRSRHARQLRRYSVGSLVAVATSHLTFLVVYAVGLSAMGSSVVGFLAGVLPNYHLNRRWTWGRRGRSQPIRELLPYAGIVLVSLLVTVFGVDMAEGWIRRLELIRPVEVVAVTAAFAAINGLLFVGKYLIFDRWLFGPGQEDDRSRSQVPTRTRA